MYTLQFGVMLFLATCLFMFSRLRHDKISAKKKLHEHLNLMAGQLTQLLHGTRSAEIYQDTIVQMFLDTVDTMLDELEVIRSEELEHDTSRMVEAIGRNGRDIIESMHLSQREDSETKIRLLELKMRFSYIAKDECERQEGV